MSDETPDHEEPTGHFVDPTQLSQETIDRIREVMEECGVDTCVILVSAVVPGPAGDRGNAMTCHNSTYFGNYYAALGLADMWLRTQRAACG